MSGAASAAGGRVEGSSSVPAASTCGENFRGVWLPGVRERPLPTISEKKASRREGRAEGVVSCFEVDSIAVVWRLSGRPDRRVKVENTNVTFSEEAGLHTVPKMATRVFRECDFFHTW
jgi:hypothetical protein